MSILVTRPIPDGMALVVQLRQRGIAAYHTPLIAFAPSSGIAEYLNTLHRYAVVIALSPRAPEFIQQRQPKEGELLWPTQISYCAVGAASAQALQRLCGQPVDYPQDCTNSEALLALPRLHRVAGERVLLLKGRGGRTLITKSLVQRGAEVIICECYQRIPITYNGFEQTCAWQRAAIDTIVVTSGEILQRLYALVPPIHHAWLLQCRLVVVSQRIARMAAHLGWVDGCVAESPDNAALLRALQLG